MNVRFSVACHEDHCDVAIGTSMEEAKMLFSLDGSLVDTAHILNTVSNDRDAQRPSTQFLVTRAFGRRRDPPPEILRSFAPSFNCH